VREDWALGGMRKDDADDNPRPAAPRPPGRKFTFFVGLLAVGAIAASAWVYTDTQRDIRRVANDIAQIKLSLELFGRQRDLTGETAGTEALQALENRLAILEESWRNAPPSPDATSQPAIAATPADAAADPQTDCIPGGTRFLVTAGDTYPVCGTSGVVEVLSVGPLEVTLADGTAIAMGGSAVLPGTSCTVAVLSAGGEGLSGYGELRVNC
jgi:hypothetical protein